MSFSPERKVFERKLVTYWSHAVDDSSDACLPFIYLFFHSLNLQVEFILLVLHLPGPYLPIMLHFSFNIGNLSIKLLKVVVNWATEAPAQAIWVNQISRDDRSDLLDSVFDVSTLLFDFFLDLIEKLDTLAWPLCEILSLNRLNMALHLP